MAAVVRFDPNRQLERDVQPMLVDDLKAAADRMANDAHNIARIQAYGPGPRHYADTIQGSARLIRGEAVGQVTATKYTSHWLESGTKFMAPRRILGQAARKSGLRVQRGRNRRR